MLTQVTRRRGLVERVPRGEEPVVEFDLPAGAYVLQIEITPAFGSSDRKTVDWRWLATIVHPLPRAGEPTLGFEMGGQRFIDLVNVGSAA